eukprot:TRINITY_DN13605_c0_g1_i1.p1 TRINITY_DN13605_c0_g1~~TRINITY_DN13605_c0_g1_i1.p1  ORF type:complete len:414 (+),score=112.73 TRINITY_DN13605_c0_g1_i1:71-1312(+)
MAPLGRYLRSAAGTAVVGGGAWWFQNEYHLHHPFEMDGTIPMLRTYSARRKGDYLPTQVAEDVTAAEPGQSPVFAGVTVETSTLLGSNGSIYRRMDFLSDEVGWDTLPFQTLVRCREDPAEGDRVWLKQRCTPDAKHVLPFYHRLFCTPLVIAEQFMGVRLGAGSRALILGSGGGAWTAFLRELYPEMQIDCVEVEPVVARHAVAHFGAPADPHTSVTVRDAVDFVREKAQAVQRGAQQPYDAVFVDLYIRQAAEPAAQGKQLAEDVAAVMAPRSVLGWHLNTRSRDNWDMWRSLYDVWGRRCAVYRAQNPTTYGTSVLLATKGWEQKDPLGVPWYYLVYQARRWSVMHNLPFDAGKKLWQNSSPCFPGLQKRWLPTRGQLDAEDRKRDELRQEMRLQREQQQQQGAEQGPSR